MISKFDEYVSPEKIISEIKEISYILEDEGFNINYTVSKNIYIGYLFIVISRYEFDAWDHRMNYKFQKSLMESEHWLEYIDRLKEILGNLGFYPRLPDISGLSRLHFEDSPINITIVVEKFTPRQKRRMLNKNK